MLGLIVTTYITIITLHFTQLMLYIKHAYPSLFIENIPASGKKHRLFDKYGTRQEYVPTGSNIIRARIERRKITNT